MAKKKKENIYSHTLFCFDIETTKKVKDTDENGKNIYNTWAWHWQIMRDSAEDPERYKGDFTSWEEFWDYLERVYEYEQKQIIIFVHNLSFEFEFLIRNSCGHELTKLFAMDTHKPLYAIFDDKFEFRCSYLLTNKSLASCGHDVGIQKGKDFDYDKIRYPGEILTPEEESYCYNDVLIMIRKIHQLEMQENLSFWDFPLTNTGFLRKETREIVKRCKNRDRLRWEFTKTALDYDHFMMCKSAFMGGYTHANFIYSGEVVENVDSFDYGSAYPWAMLAYKYPCERFRDIVDPDLKTVNTFLKNPNFLFLCEIGLVNLRAVGTNTYLSMSHCTTSKDVVVDNGRIYRASYVRTVCTCLDLKIILKAYKCDEIRFFKLSYAKASYLPEEIVLSMLKYYIRKSELKKQISAMEKNGEEVPEDMQIDYMKAKNRVNSYYGMMVQCPIRDEIELDGEEWIYKRLDWTDREAVTEKLNEFYDSRNNFLSYQWGIFVPAYTRYNLWNFILENQERIIYNDTDSAKVIDVEKCVESVEKYNAHVRWIRKKRCQQLGISDDSLADLGYFDHETKKGAYQEFKTLGAKKYLVKDYKGEYHMTVSGLSKKAVKYIEGFEDFENGVTFGADISGRTNTICITNDYADGCPDNGGVAIENTTYTLGQSADYMELTGNARYTDIIIGKNGRYTHRAKDAAKQTIKIEKIMHKRLLSLSEMEDLENAISGKTD